MSQFVQNTAVATNVNTILSGQLTTSTPILQTGQDLNLGDNTTIPIVPIVDVSPATLATKGVNIAQVGGVTANQSTGNLSVNIQKIAGSTNNAGLEPFGNSDGMMSSSLAQWPVSHSGQTLKTYSSTNAGSAITAASPVAVYTVTAGKTFYLMGFCASGLAAGINLSNSTDSIDLVSFAPGAATSETVSSSMVPIATVPASKAININTNSAGGGTIWWTMWGWEQ